MYYQDWYDVVLPIRPGILFLLNYYCYFYYYYFEFDSPFLQSTPKSLFLGCREISFSSNGFLNTNMDPTALADSHLLIACGLPGDFASGSTSSLIVRCVFFFFFIIVSLLSLLSTSI